MAQQVAASAWKVIPFFQSSDISRTVSFYIDQLGFSLGSIETDDVSSDVKKPYFCSVYAGPKAAVNLYYSRADPQTLVKSAAMIALGTKELDEMYALVKQHAEMVVLDEIQDMPWGRRQFAIADPDGNRLVFFTFLEGGNPGPE